MKIRAQYAILKFGAYSHLESSESLHFNLVFWFFGRNVLTWQVKIGQHFVLGDRSHPAHALLNMLHLERERERERNGEGERG